MIKRITKRFLSLLLVTVMVLALVPVITVPVHAATEGTVTGLANENIGLSFSGDADNAWSASGMKNTPPNRLMFPILALSNPVSKNANTLTVSTP